MILLDRDAAAAAGADSPPYQQDELVVLFDASATLGPCVARGWPLPKQIIDLNAEFRALTAGLNLAKDTTAFQELNVPDLAALWLKMEPALRKKNAHRRALIRGEYAGVIATIERRGVPIDLPMLERLRANWGQIQDALIAEVDRWGLYKDRRLDHRKLKTWAYAEEIRWPQDRNGRLLLDLDTFEEVALEFPQVVPLYDLQTNLAAFGGERLSVDADGRNRCPLRPFASKTGRNQPSTSACIFGPSVWIRSLIRPTKGRALAYLDYKSQEFGIAASLSGDPAMMAAYRSGDPYWAFAVQAGEVHAGADKAEHQELRNQFKQCCLGTQYGMGQRSLAARLSCSEDRAAELLELHRRTFPVYWAWSDAMVERGFNEQRLVATFGWTLNVRPGDNRRSVRNFMLQGNGSEMLRIACCLLHDAGVEVCAPVHDAVLIEADADEIDRVVSKAKDVMERASSHVLPGFKIDVDSKIVRFPDRYTDPRGTEMWNRVIGLLAE